MHPQPIFNLFGKDVYLYGICIGVGILACIWIMYLYTSKKNVPNVIQDFILVCAVVGIAIGLLAAKFYQAVYDWIETGTFDFYGAGLTVMGGLIGGALAFLLVYFVGGKLYFRGKREGLHLKHFNTFRPRAIISTRITFGIFKRRALF